MIDKASLFPLLLSTIAGLSTVLGAVIIFFSKTRNEKFLTFSLGFSAGVMITVSFTDLFPTAQESISKYHGKVNGILWSILFLLIGALMAYLIDIFIPKEEKGTVPNCNNNFDIFRVGLVSTIALMIHNFPEGIAVFMGAYTNIHLGLKLCLAIMLHNIPEGIAISIPLYYSGVGKKKTCLYTLLSGLSEPVGALLAYVLLKNFINDIFLAFVLIFVAGLMISLSLNDILREVKNYRDNKHMIIGFFLATVLFIISMKII